MRATNQSKAKQDGNKREREAPPRVGYTLTSGRVAAEYTKDGNRSAALLGPYLSVSHRQRPFPPCHHRETLLTFDSFDKPRIIFVSFPYMCNRAGLVPDSRPAYVHSRPGSLHQRSVVHPSLQRLPGTLQTPLWRLSRQVISTNYYR